jgi:hypothetical protein
MKDRKPWSQIKALIISDRDKNALKPLLQDFHDHVDLSADHFTIYQFSRSNFDPSVLTHSDVIFINDVDPQYEQQLKKALDIITKNNIPCWIFNNGYSLFGRIMGCKPIDVKTDYVVYLTGIGKKDPVLSVMPDNFTIAPNNYFSFLLNEDSIQVMALFQSKAPAIIKIKDSVCYASSFSPTNYKDLLMQFLREYVGYLEYLA